MGQTEMSLVSFLISKLRIREFPGDSERNAVSAENNGMKNGQF